ncbi:MAG: transporter substrate-binding domain-containing protein, partial [Anaerolineae bacterium]
MRSTNLRFLLAAAVLMLSAIGAASCNDDSSGARPRGGGVPDVLRVGTAGDYPPFSYYAESDAHELSMTGFDVDLIRAVGDELGSEIEISDFAFDGLLEALRIGQVDAVIAAMSVTPDRQALVAFSDVYYVGEDAVLARRGEPAPGVQSVGDMAGHRVGVQSGSVYETRLVEDLVEPGLTGPDDVVPYADAGQAASALASGAVDLAWGDRLPAEEASAALGLDIVALGLEQQRFAIALRHDDDELRTAINQALAALNSSGRLAVLSVEFLGLESAEVLPLPTAAPAQPVPTAVPPACEDGLEVVAHVTYDDHDLTQPPEVAPGQEFVKTWRVRNVGTCPWPAENIIRFVQGNTDAARMGGTDIELTEPVPAGDAIDVSLDLAAPLIPGLYVGFWEMAGTDGAGFGERMRVAVSVPVPPTPTPVPTLPPVREMQFDADRTVITAGESVTFSWNAPGATIAYFFRRGRDYR